MPKSIGLLMIASLPAFCQDAGISAERIRAHTRFLSSDLLEGRGVGARGGELATEYIATQLALLGAKPAGDHGTYFQKVSLVGSEPQPTTQLTAVLEKGGEVSFRWLDDFVGVNLRQTTNEEFDAP